MTTDAEVIYCARHPSVETLLRCGRCETPICPKCVVMTDVGARCPDCAPRRKLAQLEITPLFALRAIGAAIGAGAAAGAAWGLVAPDWAGLFAILIALGVGWSISESISMATNRKSGPVLQSIAVAGVVLAYFARNVVAGYGIMPGDDSWGWIMAGVAAVFAVGRLRF